MGSGGIPLIRRPKTWVDMCGAISDQRSAIKQNFNELPIGTNSYSPNAANQHFPRMSVAPKPASQKLKCHEFLKREIA